jgi:hypothetical protein
MAAAKLSTVALAALVALVATQPAAVGAATLSCAGRSFSLSGWGTVEVPSDKAELTFTFHSHKPIREARAEAQAWLDDLAANVGKITDKVESWNITGVDYDMESTDESESEVAGMSSTDVDEAEAPAFNVTVKLARRVSSDLAVLFDSSTGRSTKPRGLFRFMVRAALASDIDESTALDVTEAVYAALDALRGSTGSSLGVTRWYTPRLTWKLSEAASRAARSDARRLAVADGFKRAAEMAEFLGLAASADALAAPTHVSDSWMDGYDDSEMYFDGYEQGSMAFAPPTRKVKSKLDFTWCFGGAQGMLTV